MGKCLHHFPFPLHFVLTPHGALWNNTVLKTLLTVLRRCYYRWEHIAWSLEEMVMDLTLDRSLQRKGGGPRPMLPFQQLAQLPSLHNA